MRHTFLHKAAGKWVASTISAEPYASDLLIFFCGWATDHNTVRLLLENNSACESGKLCDVLVCYDYAARACSGTPGESALLSSQAISDAAKKYKNIYLTAWSLGVWAADNTKELIDLDREGALKQCVAVNGTLCPVSDCFGIPVAIFKGTLDNLDERNLYKFRRRMCGSREGYEQFMEFAPGRTLNSDIVELDYIFSACSKSDIGGNRLNWTKAVIGNADMIFPPKNQSSAWEAHAGQNNTLEIKEISSPHFSIDLFRQ